jgi:hypothetical protein
MDWLEEFCEAVLLGMAGWMDDHPSTLALGCIIFVFLCSIACCLAPFVLWGKLG